MKGAVRMPNYGKVRIATGKSIVKNIGKIHIRKGQKIAGR